ncbi:MAG: ABC transporter ATP-binding protein [Planctomycetota bacterium]|nr:MAG: ABC transporter ATP-binding protein [Planctomycetota bacterium]
MIHLRDLRKTYSRVGERIVACDVAELDLAEGDQVALVGPSGCGKTTLLHLVSGLLLPDCGTIEVAGHHLHELSEGKRDRFRAGHVGYVHQTFQLLQPFSALENVQLAVLFGRGAGADALDPLDLLERVGLGHRLRHHPSELSVGQQQRVAIARALVNRPKLLLADEPLGNQDAETGAQVLDLMLELAEELGSTVLMVTHDVGQAQRLQRRIDLRALAAGRQEA